MANWFECKVKFDKMMETGVPKTVNEPYLVDALSFTEAESRIIEAMTPYISGEFTVSAVKRTNISEIFWDETGDYWYMVKTMFITIDERSGVEKKKASYILVRAGSFKDALDNFMAGMKDTLSDFEIASIVKTPLVDVFKADLAHTRADREAAKKELEAKENAAQKAELEGA